MAIDPANGLVLCYHRNPGAIALGQRIAALLGTTTSLHLTDRDDPLPDSPPSVVVTVGGDGTLLRAARMAAPLCVPLLGINTGRVGFLTELEASDAEALILRYLTEPGFAWHERRRMVKAVLGEAVFHALNEVVVGRGPAGNVSRINVSINGAHMTTYTADAVIVATATGSTAYSLAAGGPILHPEAEDLVITPVASHGDLAAPLVVPPTSLIEIEAQSQAATSVAADGFADVPLHQGDRVVVTASEHRAEFLRAGPAESFYETLVYRLRRGSDQTLSVARMLAEQEARARG